MLIKLDEVIDKILKAITTLLYLIMIAIVLIQILARYTPSITMSWTEEFTRLLFVYIVCLGAPLAIKYEEYADVDLLTIGMKAKVKRIVYALTYALMVIFCAVLVVSGLNFAEVGTYSVSPAMKLPMVIHHSSILITGVLCGLYSLIQLYGIFRNKKVLRGGSQKWQQ